MRIGALGVLLALATGCSAAYVCFTCLDPAEA
jgi:hypothetical protein